jgi:hypothetical protein
MNYGQYNNQSYCRNPSQVFTFPHTVHLYATPDVPALQGLCRRLSFPYSLSWKVWEQVQGRTLQDALVWAMVFLLWLVWVYCNYSCGSV